jgi:hypothetical protein
MTAVVMVCSRWEIVTEAVSHSSSTLILMSIKIQPIRRRQKCRYHSISTISPFVAPSTSFIPPLSSYKSRNKTPNVKIIKSLLNGGISFAFCIHAVVKHRFFGNAVEMLLRRKGFTGHIVLNIFLLKKIVMRSLL